MTGEKMSIIKLLLSALAHVSAVELSIELLNAGMTHKEISSFNKAVMKISAGMGEK